MFTNFLDSVNKNILELINSPLVGIDVLIDNNKLNLNEFNVNQNECFFNYKKGFFNYYASFFNDHFSFKLNFKAIFNFKTNDLFSMQLTISPDNSHNCNFVFIPYICKDLIDSSSKTISTNISSKGAYICTANSDSHNITSYAMKCEVFEGDFKKTYFNTKDNNDNLLSYSLKAKSLAGSPVTISKYCCIISGLNGTDINLNKKALSLVKKSCIKGFDNKRI